MYMILALGIAAAIYKVIYSLDNDSNRCELLYGMGPMFEAITTRCCVDYDIEDEPEYGVHYPPNFFETCHAENHVDVFDCVFPNCFGKLLNIVDINGVFIGKTGLRNYFSKIPTSDAQLKNMYSECARKNFTNYGPHPEVCDMLKVFYCKNYAQLKLCQTFYNEKRCELYNSMRGHCAY
ncbi:uncharacterized protein LOC113226400 [Hyposmocoma kahamanoa]|uniref:uncharacterized protein LOC113226400 n=1 Tax=Hyposmocoma kahamanoa TaxID=1477025 RepID=UPI000E6D794B|nr:uncharacterized protein LOC113226400 [Hyposmocoma kahamanoa]